MRFDFKAGQVVDEEPLKTLSERYDAHHDNDEKQKWYLNLSFFVGQQWVVYNEVQGTLIEPKAPSWRVRLTINRILPIVRTEYAKLTAGRHVWEVLPATGEEEDVNVAKVGTKFLDSKWRELEMDDKREELVLWVVACGTGFLKTWFDKSLGASSPAYDEAAEKYQPMGDVNTAVIPPFEIVPDPDATSMSDAKWVIHAKAYDVKTVQDVYGRKVKADTEESILQVWAHKVKTMLGIDKTATGQADCHGHHQGAVAGGDKGDPGVSDQGSGSVHRTEGRGGSPQDEGVRRKPYLAVPVLRLKGFGVGIGAEGWQVTYERGSWRDTWVSATLAYRWDGTTRTGLVFRHKF